MRSFQSFDPVTGELAGEYTAASDDEVRRHVGAAHAAAACWALLPVHERLAALAQLKRALAAATEELSEVISQELGKPVQDALAADILPSLRALQWLSRHAASLLSARRIPGRPHARLTAHPYGVVGVIGTWNYPLYLNLTPIAWALAAGNAVVWKPSELAPASALALQALFDSAGLPVRMAMGDAATGSTLCAAGCDKIAFTGSNATGRKILKILAETATPSVMELSGRDAAIVREDADIASAARALVWARCMNAGQSCVAPQRLYVAARVAEPFIQAAYEQMRAIRPEIEMGPLRTAALRDAVHAAVEQAIHEGGRLVYGGHALGRPGYFYAPTLITGREIEADLFGPVLCVIPVQDDAKAIQRINAGTFGLGASIWTRDMDAARRMAHAIQTGMVTVNEALLDAGDPALPFGGRGASGFGKLRGAAGLEEFTQWRTVVTHPAVAPRRHLFPYRPATAQLLTEVACSYASQDPATHAQSAFSIARAAVAWSRTSEGATPLVRPNTHQPEAGS